MERLAEMFPDSSYQRSLDSYLATKGITDAAQLENYINEFNYSHKEKYIWNNFLKQYLKWLKKSSRHVPMLWLKVSTGFNYERHN